MLLVKLNNQQVVKYPYSREEMVRDNPHVSFPIILNGADLAMFNAAQVQKVTPPPHNILTHRATEINPILEDNRWVQKWELVELNAESKASEMQTLMNAYDWAMQQHFDKKAQEKGYDNRITCALRAGFSGPFQAEGIAFAQWMDNCYEVAYTTLDRIKNYEIDPVSNSALIEGLPPLTWPQ